MFPSFLRHLAAFCVIYPLLMTAIWSVAALIHFWFRERRQLAAPAPEGPPAPVSILIPCHNEEVLIAETVAALSQVTHPDFEVLAIDDGSTDRTVTILRGLAQVYPWLRVIRQPKNMGKAAALIAGAAQARHEFLVCIDADAILDPRAPEIFARALAANPKLGAVTGNPRVRNTSTLLGKLQSGEFSAIIAVIKRAQQWISGRVFTISGVVCGFRKEALASVGWWSQDMAAEDIDITWKLNLAGWGTAYMPNALCQVLMPESVGGLWRQRLRWAQGGCEVLWRYGRRACRWSSRHVWPLFFELVAGLLWSHAVALAMGIWLFSLLTGSLTPGETAPGYELFPPWSRFAMGVATVTQFAVGFYLDARYEPGRRAYFSLVWYPLAYWIIGVTTSVAGFAKATFRPHSGNATWISPDRGYHPDASAVLPQPLPTEGPHS
jgi:biofilm PGA synthesis N-glycosyltransferase PgaC